MVVQATSRQITDITEMLKLQADQIDNLGNDIYELNISTIHIDVPELLSDMSSMAVEDLNSSAQDRTEKIESFANNREFYAGAKRQDGYKIISDEFSNLLNAELYKGFSVIERKLRQLAIENFQFKGRALITPRNGGSKKSPDHIMSQFELGDFFENLLKAPASEGYMKAEWRRSEEKGENEVIRIASLTVLDEIKPGLTISELNAIRKQRNKCMHFSVVTPSEYRKIVPIMNKYLRQTATREFSRKIKNATKGLQEYLRHLFQGTSQISKRATEMAAFQIDQSRGLAGAIKKMLESQD